MNHKVDADRQLRTDTGTHVLCLTETWHEDTDAISIQDTARRRPPGSSALQTNPKGCENRLHQLHHHGGVAIVAATNVKLEKVPLRSVPKNFERDCARITSGGAS